MLLLVYKDLWRLVRGRSRAAAAESRAHEPAAGPAAGSVPEAVP
jgi:hypothetical protein